MMIPRLDKKPPGHRLLKCLLKYFITLASLLFVVRIAARWLDAFLGIKPWCENLLMLFVVLASILILIKYFNNEFVRKDRAG